MKAVAPPADLAAEESVLRAWISDAEFRQAWAPEVELFHSPVHRTIALIMAKRSGAKRFGEATLLAELEREKKIGGEITRDRVLHAVSGAVVADPWADVDRLRELSALRALQHELREAHEAIGTGARLHEVQGRVRAADSAAVDAMGIKLWTAKDLAHSVHEHVSSTLPLTYCTTCYQRIDNVTGGIRPGDGWVLRADTSWGKSSYGGVAVPDENIIRGKRVLIVTNEDSPELYARRIACRRARVPYRLLRDRRLNHFQKGLVDKHIIDLEQRGNLWVLPAKSWSIERICGVVRSAIRIHKLKLVVLDYAQKLWAEHRTENRERELYYCAERFSDTCSSDNAASLLLSQLTRNDKGENRTKGAGAIKDASEICLEGCTSDRAGAVSKSIRLVKVKEGRAGGEFDADWDEDSASFKADLVSLELGLEEQEE